MDIRQVVLGVVVCIGLAGCEQSSQALPVSQRLSADKVEAIAGRIAQQHPQLSSAQRPQVLETVIRSLDDMVFIEGGEFEMGDFGWVCNYDPTTMCSWPCGYDPNDLCPITGKLHDDYLHQVRLSGYHLSRYQTRLGDFDLFRTAQGLPPFDQQLRKREDLQFRYRPDNPAPTKEWQEAKDYCLWLGALSGYPVDLPTEAQWEYAARNRGQYVMYPTDTGSLDYGRNIPKDEGERVFPVGQFAPNPLGLYDLTANATDWVNDWYAADYYQHSPVDNPQGPETGTQKVRRGSTIAESRWLSGNSVRRWGDEPSRDRHYPTTSFRCAIQLNQPL